MQDTIQYKPIDSNIVYKLKKQEETYGSIIMAPASGTQTPEWGEVIAVGPGKVAPMQSVWRFFIPFLPPKRVPMQVKVGDTIYVGRQTAMRIDKYESHNNEAGTEYKVLPEDRIFFKL